MLQLYLEAPFGTFRTFTAGTFRPTAGFITFSAAYGLLLNVAGIEMRFDDGKSPMTLIKSGLPRVSLALGALELPLRHSLYQQIHNYPVGSHAKEHSARTMGCKYNIITAKRDLLSQIKAYLCLDGNEELEGWVQEGLAGRRPRSYGLPFLGDNNFIVDRLELVSEMQPAHWLEPAGGNPECLERGAIRLTITIDRGNMSRTRSKLFTPRAEKLPQPPPSAWVEVNYP